MNDPDDDVGRLAELRAAGSDLDAERKARLRNRLLDTIEADDPTVRARLAGASAGPPAASSAGQSGVPPASPPAGPPAVLVDLEDESATAARSARSRLGVVAVAVAAAVVLVIGAVFVLRSGEQQPSLNDLAADARAAEDRPLGDTEFIHQQITRREGSGDDAAVHRSEIWVDQHANARERLVEEDGSGSDTMYDGDAVDFAGISYDALRALPTSPQNLLLALAERPEAADPAGATEALATILSLPVTPPAVRAAALDTLAELGAVPIGTVVDPEGRQGDGYAVATDTGGEVVVVLDPDTAMTMAIMIFPTAGGDRDPATASRSTTYLVSDVQPDRASPPTTG